MANLIITIISIALVAIVAIMGVYYGGTALQEGQAKAGANAIINQFKQAETAINIWATQNGGNMPDCANDYPANCASTSSFTSAELNGFLTPDYMTANFFTQAGMRLYRNPTWGTSGMQNGFMVILDNLNPKLNEAVCKQLEAQRTGSSPSDLRVWLTPPSDLINNIACGKFGCVRDSAGNSWGAAEYVAYYRHTGAPTTNEPDCQINP